MLILAQPWAFVGKFKMCALISSILVHMATAGVFDGLDSVVPATLAEEAVAASDNLDGNLLGMDMNMPQSYVPPYKYLVICTGGVAP